MLKDPSPSAAPPLPFLTRIVGVVIDPTDTMASVAAHPRWLGVLTLTTVLASLGLAWFLSTDVGKTAYVDQAVAMVESFGGTVTEEAYARVQAQAEYAAAIQGVSALVFGPIVTVVIAAVLFGVFTVLGGEARFAQVLAVVSHAGVITLLQQVFTLPMNYQRESMGSTTNLSVFFPNLPDGSLLASVLGLVDLFWIWYLVVLAIGVAAVYCRRWTSVAAGLFAVYIAIGLAIGAIKLFLGGR